MTDDTRCGIEFVKDFAVRLGLTLVETGATADSAPTYSLYYGKSCLLMSSFPMQVEAYLWGYRDGKGLPDQSAKDLVSDLGQLMHELAMAKKNLNLASQRVLDIETTIEPLTRERSGV